MLKDRYRILVYVSVVLLGLLIFALPAEAGIVPGGNNPSSQFGGVYRRPLNNNPPSLDPARTADIYAYTVVNQLFDGLVQFDSHLNPVPAIAGFWEASVDGLTWTFYLRKDAKFHNGRGITADDFVYSLSRILQPETRSPVAEFFQYIKGAEEVMAGKTSRVEGLKALDPYTLQITLEEPYTPFLSILAMANAKVVPREEVERLGERFASQPVGSGPFRFVRWDQNEQIVLQAYEKYYEGRPFLDQVVFKIGKQDVENLDEFLRGNLEEAAVPSMKREEINRNPRYRSYLHLRKPTLHLLYIGFNNRKAPFTNPKVRQAFNYAINMEEIIREIRKGGSVVAKGVLPPGMPGYNPNLQAYYYNPKRARQLLAEAGYPNGEGLPVIDLWFATHEKSARAELEAYRQYLADIGVRVEIHQAPNWKTFKKMLQAGQPSMFRLAWYADIPDPDNFFFPLLYSQSKTNRTFYHNPQVDQFMEEARRETDYLRRVQLYRTMEQLVVNDAPWISQHHKVFEFLYQPYVRGVEINSLGAPYIPMKKIWLERPKDQQARRGEKDIR
ncbi:MAG: ABC transporter substrate-binding protein [Nitrospinota bacterium]|nr:MAG: ABC transporter substrate-binding protein [Nitrospinota bacterium]